MDLRQLEILRAVADTGSFTGAGQQLHLSQSAVSRQILLLEEELHEQLFLRLGRKVRITPTGTTLRAIGGDWSQCAYGVGMDITMKVSTEASYVDEAGNTVSAFQNNLVLLLVEAYFGFVKSDASAAWTAYVDAV